MVLYVSILWPMKFETFDVKQNESAEIFIYFQMSQILRKLVCILPLLEGKYKRVFPQLVGGQTPFLPGVLKDGCPKEHTLGKTVLLQAVP